MAKTKQKKPGRPATGKDPMIGLRAPPELRHAIEVWAASQEDMPGLSEAIRRLVEIGLSHAPKNGRLSHEARAKASALAGKVVDQLTDSNAPEEEQQKRKRRLIHGPREFRDVRKDQHRHDSPGQDETAVMNDDDKKPGSKSRPVETNEGAMDEYLAKQNAERTKMAKLREARLAAEAKAAGEKAKRKPAAKAKR